MLSNRSEFDFTSTMPAKQDAMRSSNQVKNRTRSTAAAVALVVGIAALSAQAVEATAVRDIQRYCTACWKNARLDPGVWDDCTQEVCVRLIAKARSGELDLSQVLADDTPERRELVRAIDMVRKRVQRSRRFSAIDAEAHADRTQPLAQQIELGELLESARRAVLTDRQDRILELWTQGWQVPDIAAELKMPVARVSDEKYKALRKLERHLGPQRIAG